MRQSSGPRDGVVRMAAALRAIVHLDPWRLAPATIGSIRLCPGSQRQVRVLDDCPKMSSRATYFSHETKHFNLFCEIT